MSSVGPTLYRGTAEPTTGRDGDIWMDTSTTPPTPMQYSDGAWVDLVDTTPPTPGANDTGVTQWIRTASNYTLTNTTSAQKVFNTTTNGALTLETGVYEFEWLTMVDLMSATSGNAGFELRGAGTATMEKVAASSVGYDASNLDFPDPLSGLSIVTTNTPTPAVDAGTGDALWHYLSGIFTISAAGTIIPSILLQTGTSNAYIKAGSYFKIRKIGETGTNYYGNWT